MTLDQVKAGGQARVVSISGSGRISKRLMEMGVVPGIVITVVKSAPFGDPVQIRLLGYSMAVRRSEAQAVTVEADAGGAGAMV
jgi:ferrous iron transport protein A